MVFFFKQKTAYEMRMSDWSSDVCSSDLIVEGAGEDPYLGSAMAAAQVRGFQGAYIGSPGRIMAGPKHFAGYGAAPGGRDYDQVELSDSELWNVYLPPYEAAVDRSEEHTSALQSLMRITYAVFCLK